MPNWCENTLTVTGPEEQMAALREAAKLEETRKNWRGEEYAVKAPFALQALHPCPPALYDLSGGSDEIYVLVVYGDWKKFFEQRPKWLPEGVVAKIKTRDDLIEALDEKFKDNLFTKGRRVREIAKKYTEAVEKYGYASWYPWCVDNWGTKWDVSNVSEERVEPTEWEVRFSTAWGPPLMAFDKISADYPDLDFTVQYEEEGMWFAGAATFKAGKRLRDGCDDIDTFDPDRAAEIKEGWKKEEEEWEEEQERRRTEGTVVTEAVQFNPGPDIPPLIRKAMCSAVTAKKSGCKRVAWWKTRQGEKGPYGPALCGPHLSQLKSKGHLRWGDGYLVKWDPNFVPEEKSDE